MGIRSKFEEIVLSEAQFITTLPWENKEFYENWLAQQFFIVSHTPRLLCAFALRVPFEDRAGFYNVLGHLKDESGHDLWLLNDLKALGKKPSDFKQMVCGEALIKSQYYQIQHDDPSSLFGYSQFLEYLSAIAAGGLAERVEKVFGKNTAVFLKGHSHVDADHAEEGWKMLSAIPEGSYPKIIENLNMTSQSYRRLLTEIRDQVESKNRKAVA